MDKDLKKIKKDQKRKKVILKYVIVILLIAVVVFGGINFIWYEFKYLPYKKIADKMNFNNDFEIPRYSCSDDKYIYSLKMPGYLAFQSGFLYIGPRDEEMATMVADEEGNLIEENIPHVDMFIWPQVFSETQYGITIYEEESSIQLMINGDGELLADTTMSKEEKENAMYLINEHKDEIQDILKTAKEVLGDKILVCD